MVGLCEDTRGRIRDPVMGVTGWEGMSAHCMEFLYRNSTAELRQCFPCRLRSFPWTARLFPRLKDVNRRLRQVFVIYRGTSGQFCRSLEKQKERPASLRPRSKLLTIGVGMQEICQPSGARVLMAPALTSDFHNSSSSLPNPRFPCWPPTRPVPRYHYHTMTRSNGPASSQKSEQSL